MALWAQVLLVCSVALAFVWAATQWTAGSLAYQAQLGSPWFRVDGYPVYQPPVFFWWWFSYDAYAPRIFQHGAYIAAAGGLAAVLVAIAMSLWRAREAKHADTYGSARWATEREMRRGGPARAGRRHPRPDRARPHGPQRAPVKPGLEAALQPYCERGPWGRLLDADVERLGVADVQAIETEGLIGTGAAAAVLSYLFHRIEDRLDGRPILLIMDEGWLALDDEGFSGQLREWLRSLRKKTQMLADRFASWSDQ